MAEVVLDKITKVYDDGFLAVSELSVDIADGEFIVLVGPSGSGKSTALRMIAGLEDISSGELRIGGRPVNDVPAKDRDIAMVFQNYALYPHMSVRENIAFALKLRRLPKEEIGDRVERAARMLELSDMLDRKPGQLSGGQRQRVAMGRAIVREPKAFLMDEPLSNLDAKLRVAMRAEIARIQKDLGVTTVYVTHDQVEAMTMGDRVAVLNKGMLQQVDAPQTLYDRPNNLFVAGFIGSPSMNFLRGKLSVSDGSVEVTAGSQVLAVDPGVLDARPKLRSYDGNELVIGVRPEDMEDAEIAGDTPPERRLKAKVDLTEALGSEIIVHFTTDAPRAVTEHMRELEEDVGEGGDLTSGQRDTSRFTAAFSPRSSARIGSDIEIAVDTGRLHFFDLGSGSAIWE